MELKQIISFLICPYCHKGKLRLKTKIFCSSCKRSYEIVNGIPIMINKRLLNKQEKNQQKIFNTHYSYFSEEKLKLKNLRLRMLKRIFDNNFCDDDEYSWRLEKKDINKNPSGMQLNAIFKKK